MKPSKTTSVSIKGAKFLANFRKALFFRSALFCRKLTGVVRSMYPPLHQLLGAHAISSQRSRGGTGGMILPARAVRKC